MTNIIRLYGLKVQAVAMAWLLIGSSQAQAAGNDFSDIAGNITESIEELPGMISGIAYLMGLLLGALGILKIKDHVENPTQTPLKDGAVRLAAGGALFALPIITESMQNTIGATNSYVEPAQLSKVELRVR